MGAPDRRHPERHVVEQRAGGTDEESLKQVIQESMAELKTVAAGGIPGFQMLADAWGKQAPLGWDVTDPEPVARTICFLLSDWARAISGEIVHVDGGFHAMGTALNP